tara:strand:+ start:629 stop:862 length:234 start_codon:yes stop_codon:yes gene_type:complete
MPQHGHLTAIEPSETRWLFASSAAGDGHHGAHPRRLTRETPRDRHLADTHGSFVDSTGATSPPLIAAEVDPEEVIQR